MKKKVSNKKRCWICGKSATWEAPCLDKDGLDFLNNDAEWWCDKCFEEHGGD